MTNPPTPSPAPASGAETHKPSCQSRFLGGYSCNCAVPTPESPREAGRTATDQGWTKKDQQQEPELKGEGTMRAVKFWTCDEDIEQLTHYDISEAVESWADRMHPRPLPETVTVYGYAEMELPRADFIAARALSEIVEYLDDEYGDQIHHEDTHITPALKAAALAFAEAVRREYPVWSCERVTSVVVKVADHVPAAWLQLGAEQADPSLAVDPSRSTPEQSSVTPARPVGQAETPEAHVSERWCADLRCKRCYGATTWQTAEVTKLRAEVARLTEDAERLDWLEAEHRRVDPVAALTVKRFYRRDSNEWANVASNVRGEIDTARRSPSPDGAETDAC